jgi:exodeoxyribonuclease VII large subunit
MLEPSSPANSPPIWQVGALCRAIADALDARFNPVAVRGEVTGFTRASSGHCYLTLKDESGQIRCAMFRRAALLLDFLPRDGELVEVRGRLDVYGPRGDLQLIIESMRRAGQGALFEQFLRVKAKLEAEGLFDAARKRPIPALPRGIGIVTSMGAAALHDVATALQRRVPHIPVVLASASVQGANAATEVKQALVDLYRFCDGDSPPPEIQPTQQWQQISAPIIDVILLVRGGGSMEDLAAFNDESLARAIAASPVPVITGIGHETDFTIADFCADLRAPTPTAAAELVAQSASVWLNLLQSAQERLQGASTRCIDTLHQGLDSAAQRMGRPSEFSAKARAALAVQAQRLNASAQHFAQRKGQNLQLIAINHSRSTQRDLERRCDQLERLSLRLGLLDPSLVLQRGYAWLADAQGHTVTSVLQTHPGQSLTATLADGTVDVTVANPA